MMDKWDLGRRRVGLFMLACMVFGLLFANFVHAPPPTPHNIQGRVFSESGNGVANGIPVTINDTVTDESVYTEVFAPPIPQLMGSYSTVISGGTGDAIVGYSWNTTHYGFNTTFLSASTTSLNIILNASRGSEPNVSILFPVNNSVIESGPAFNVTANISIVVDDGTNCNATIAISNDLLELTADQSATKDLGDITEGDHVVLDWNVTGVGDGAVIVTVSAQCGSDDIYFEHVNQEFILFVLNDTIPPVVNIEDPLNNTFTGSNITFLYNVSERTGIENCSLYVNDELNQTSNEVDTYSQVSFTLNNTVEGDYSWFISCFDNSSNFNEGNSSLFFFDVDFTAPNVTLLDPANNSAISKGFTNFHFNVSDRGNVTNCSLILNNEFSDSTNSVVINASNEINATLTAGIYNWSVNCTDAAGNTGSSEFYLISAPDLEVRSDNILFIPSSPVDGQLIQINASVYSFGVVNTTTSIIVQFFENNSLGNITQIGSNFSVNITTGDNISFEVNYTAELGVVDIIVLVDPPIDSNGSVVELNESNNRASKLLVVPSYHIYYGDVISQVFLDSFSEQTVLDWGNVSDSSGNIYVADSDSLISFSSLLALGVNTSDDVRLDDFEELDTALNLTSVDDSLNNTFLVDGVRGTQENFTVFLDPIANVSVVNSTNSSHFVTGILWDTSDTHPGGFNGSQDVVFIARMDQERVGLYGTYDYEVKVPGSLTRYIQPDALTSVNFYREIT